MDWTRGLVAFLAIASLVIGPWLSLSAGAGSIDYKIFNVIASGDSFEFKSSYPEMVLRHQEGDKGIEVTLSANLSKYIKFFQVWAIITIVLFVFSTFLENQRRLYLASGASLLLMAFVFLLVAYHVTSSMNLVNSLQDLLFGKAVRIKILFTRTYLTLQVGWGWLMAIIASAVMLVYGWKYRYWKAVW